VVAAPSNLSTGGATRYRSSPALMGRGPGPDKGRRPPSLGGPSGRWRERLRGAPARIRSASQG